MTCKKVVNFREFHEDLIFDKTKLTTRLHLNIRSMILHKVLRVKISGCKKVILL
jgi:hypothetical protein